MKRWVAAMLIISIAGVAPSFAAGPYYARGDYYAGTAGLWGADAGNELFDDGLHGDGAAGDGVYGAYVVSDQPIGVYGFKIGNADWSEAYPSHPFFPLSNAVVWTNGPGDVVHFVLDTNPRGDGWQPAQYAVATDQYAPPFLEFELIGSAPETGSWNTGVAAIPVGPVWRTTLQIANAGNYEFKFRVVGTWDICNFGVHYNMFVGDNFTYATTKADSKVLFEMDTATGQGRAVEVSETPTRSTSWGRIRALYR